MSRPTSPGPVLASARAWHVRAHVIVSLGIGVMGSCLAPHAVIAADVDKGPVEQAWCVEAADGTAPPDCTYSDFLRCAMNAVRGGGSCKAQSSIQTDAINARGGRSTTPSRRSTTATASHPKADPSLSAADREKLFHRFVEWTSSHPKADSSLSTAEREKLFRQFVEWTQRRSDQ
jgi:hypothetical protein